ncbi:hypothetical protein L3Q70_17415 (plasmid) [Pseudoalteromonas sp. CF6-2]|uniref:hypothetical protein n=1 Tax=Pseudoalteromonas sp. CF6-2 TaxID=562716 RepID=UPI001F3C5AB3|nr:hypothetical protein L3Q70_17415 [Pseudoalteromonas sp. CF6-2]
MKITLYAMALFSAFFVYADEPDLDTLVPAKVDTVPCSGYYRAGTSYDGTTKVCGPTKSENDLASCELAVSQVPQSEVRGGYYTTYYKDTFCRLENGTVQGYQNVQTVFDDPSTPDSVYSSKLSLYAANLSGEETYFCPPDNYPEHTIKVENQCAKPKAPEPEEPDPSDCDEFGNNSFLPPNDSLNVPAGGSVCYTTASGSQCKFKKNPFGSGYEQTGEQCTGEEPPYPEPDITPPDNPDDPNACATVGTTDPHAVCPVNPNDVCNRIIVKGSAGDKVMNQCPAGCGSVNGQYVCAYPDKNGDGIPDENQDPQKGNDTKDPNDPNDETPDSTKTNNLLYGLDKKIGIGNSRLTGIKTGIEGMTKEQMKGNGSLAAIASNTAKTANNTLGISENTAEILKSISETEISDSFNPENSASFYESSYEEGFTGVWQEKSAEFKQTEAYQFLQQFKFNGGGSAPDTRICFNLGSNMDFGCAELPVPDAGLLAILKVFILISAAFLCRRIIFGG